MISTFTQVTYLCMSHVLFTRMGNYIVKHLRIFVKDLRDGAVALSLCLEWSTFSHVRWADGLGRFSGTMVSSEFSRHGWHRRWLLHCILLFFDSTTNSAPLATPECCWDVNFIISPFCKVIIMHAVPITRCLLHDPSFPGLFNILNLD